MYISCIFTFRSMLSHDTTKTLIFDAFLRGKAGFLMTRQKVANLLYYYMEKQVFPWHAKTPIFDALIRGKAGFLMTRRKTKCAFDALRFVAGFLMMRQNSNIICIIICSFVALLCEKAGFLMTRQKLSNIWCIITWKSRFFHGAPKRCSFVALLCEKAGFLMTHQKLLYLMH